MTEWWRDAVFYEIYVRSFADSNGDGVGDLPGIAARLPYLRDLGVDAIWLTPFYPSPGADHGYDVSDYVDVDPRFGTLADFDALVARAHELGLRRDRRHRPEPHLDREHPWFAGDRSRYVTRPAAGGLPNNWPSNFGGPAWTLDEERGEYYLHLFAPEQPDLDWHNPQVRDDFERDPALLARPRRRRLPHRRRPRARQGRDARRRARAVPGVALLVRLAHRDRPARGARGLPRLARARPTPTTATACSSARSSSPTRRASRRTCGRTSCSSRSTSRSSSSRGTRRRSGASIDASLAALPIVTWVLENHDVTRIATRFGKREARAAALLLLALPGPAFLYQGQELGLEEVDLPDALRQDPVFRLTGGERKGRDGCRVPIAVERAAARALVAAAAAVVGRALGRGAARRPALDALALPPRARAAAGRRVRVAREPARGRSSSSATGSSAP